MKRNVTFEFLLALLLTACSVTAIMTPMPQYTLDDQYAWFRRPLRVVVLPFSHAVGAPGSGVRISELVASRLDEVENFRYIPPSEAAERLKLNPVAPEGVPVSRAAQLGKRLDADLVIVGAVTDYRVLDPSGSAQSVGRIWRAADLNHDGRIESQEGYWDVDPDFSPIAGTACILGGELHVVDVASKAVIYDSQYACTADTFLEGEKDLVRVLLRPLWDLLTLHE